MTQQQHLKLIPRVQLQETLFFLLLTRHTIPHFFQDQKQKETAGDGWGQIRAHLTMMSAAFFLCFIQFQRIKYLPHLNIFSL